MKKSIFGYVVAVGVGALGAYGLAKLDESRRFNEEMDRHMKEFDELDKKLSDQEEHLHGTYQEIIELDNRIDKLLEVLENDEEGFYERLREVIRVDDSEVETE